ncbi:hypothetical protein N7532_007076 [Penicillium argentinense]|uniref:RNA helicase n=1 Tax=Penicillium argentinense TaxID=1131581 RepID=A0A9W9FH88_9EURO|nr:uncharacterized protein N7532_007076 [Penicillium argentinense]KAJ5100075.1 hypothetical protein N7532_007076 [Penicillium argentinense]
MAASKLHAPTMSPIEKSSNSSKRKRDLDPNASTSTPTKKHKKEKKRASLSTPSSAGDESNQKRKRLKDGLQGSDTEASPRKTSFVSPDSRKKATSNSHNGIAKASKKPKDGARKSSRKDNSADDEPAAVSPKSMSDEEEAQASDDTQERKASKNKHAGILSKFERTKSVASAKAKKTKPQAEETVENVAEPVIAKGLEPLPQPENPPEPEEAPTYSSLPPWLANPLRTSTEDRTKFSELGIKEDLLRILTQNNYKEAFAVQSAVIPLLLDGDRHHPGDLCISAATGSGKTLSYVVPLVTSLESRPASRLRGLIVVPTRELVKQAREACELCAAGSRLHIGSAVGNVAIKEEQKLIMRTDQVYNPATVAQRQAAGLQDNDWEHFSLEDCVSEAINSTGFLPGYIQRPEPNVDILICTPGRLVDHLRYTKGFTLKHIEWLVIDEADRLLNESFQEWVDVVNGSLDSRQAPESWGAGGKFLSELGHPIESKPPRKVVLSATMTRDISKLNSLRLANPKMVIIGADNPDTNFTLPSTLREHVVAVKDESIKPLYLLHLLLSHIGVKAGTKATCRDDASNSDSTSSDDTSSDGETSSDDSSDDETSSSGSDSESDSDSDSDTSSDASSDISDSSSDSDSDSEIDSDPKSKPKSVQKLQAGPTRQTVLIFTKSSESASRLHLLISLINRQLASRMATIIKSNKSSASRKTLSAYRKGKIDVIVATDRASRGLDLHSLLHVVNYDVPSSATTYVHRVGRTARAGRKGSAWSLVTHREGKWFASEIASSIDGPITRTSAIERASVKLDSLKPLQPKFAMALDKLEQEVRASKTHSSKR